VDQHLTFEHNFPPTSMADACRDDIDLDDRVGAEEPN